MADEFSEELQPIMGLAKARELLIIDAKDNMPPGAKAQRAKMIATIENQINSALAVTAERLPAIAPEGMDQVSAAAWNFVVSQQNHPINDRAEGAAYEKLKRVFDERSDLRQTAADGSEGILYWVRQTHHVPKGVPEEVADEAIAAVAVFEHRLLAQPSVRQWIEEVDRHPDQLHSDADRRNFELMKIIWREAAGLDESFVNQYSRVTSDSNTAWENAKPSGNFEAWQPKFEEVVELSRRKGEMLAADTGDSPYQALLGSAANNAGLRNETVNKIFGELRAKLPKLIHDISEKQHEEDPPLPLPHVAVAVQERIMRRIARELGLPEANSRMDTSPHAFSTGQWTDTRITTRPYQEDNMWFALRAIIHEVGHSLYSLGLPDDLKGQPVGDYQSIWVHESQSLFWERQVAASLPFMKYLSKVIKEELAKEDTLNPEDPAWSAENLYKMVTRVQPSLIRVMADEVTYPVHVILRHDLEQKLIDGTLAVKDIPEAWNKGMKEMLGIDVPDNTRGCMQDIHWSKGSIGSFPSYTFGALTAAQLMEKAKRDIPGIDGYIEKGDFSRIREWLNKKIHQQGSRYDGEELIERATGKPLTAEAWLKKTEERYLTKGRDDVG